MKPEWLLYAAQVREELKKVTPTKSGKRYDAHLLLTWKIARFEKGYQGSERDWDFLVHNYDKVNSKREHNKKV